MVTKVIIGYLNINSQKSVTVRVEYNPITKAYWSRFIEMSEETKKKLNKQFNFIEK